MAGFLASDPARQSRSGVPVCVPPSIQFVPNLIEVLMEIKLIANGMIDRIELN